VTLKWASGRAGSQAILLEWLENAWKRPRPFSGLLPSWLAATYRFTVERSHLRRNFILAFT
jgi:hypothetical protein